MSCTCKNYKENMHKIDNLLTIPQVRAPGRHDTSWKPITHCPWCGKPLIKEPLLKTYTCKRCLNTFLQHQLHEESFYKHDLICSPCKAVEVRDKLIEETKLTKEYNRRKK